jgi:NtrC-family two-component system sensor histidine kinase KinB
VTRFGPPRLGFRRSSPPTLLRVYLLGGTIVLAVGFLLYFYSLAKRVDAQTEAMSNLTARLIAFTTLTVGQSPDPATQQQFRQTIADLSFPVILTDVTGRPLAWSDQVKVPTMPIEDLAGADLEHPAPGLARVLALRDRMDRATDPIPMLQPGTQDTLVYFHYGRSWLAAELRWIPWVAIGVAMLFGVLGLLMIRSFKRSEESFIWAGMAKETAHQMGTPLSSLAGWLAVLRDEAPAGGDAVTVPRPLFDEVLGEIEQDTGRLNRVAARFSQIGSRPKLEATAIPPLVQSTVDYFRRRFPQGVDLVMEVPDALPLVQLNPELFGWVLENLVKNALNAVDQETGRIRIGAETVPGKDAVAITVTDNGKGVVPGMEKAIFRPGVSTRHRGWGLGLPLSRRIVEQYHGGRLDLTGSVPGQATTFRILLPAVTPGAPAGPGPARGLE